MSIPEDIRLVAHRAALVNDFEGRCIAIGLAIIGDRKQTANAALKHLIDIVEGLDWWREDTHDREFPGDSLIDARAFIASLSPREA
jgi:hypothetical protein